MALRLTDVGCVRGDRLLFSGVSAWVPSGRVLRVQGENGAGKTTLLRTICGLASPEQGRIEWQDLPVTALRDAGGLVYLGHSPALKGDLSALENLQAATGLAGAASDAREALDALRQAGLTGREHLPVRTLSQGLRKRAALARLAQGGVGGGLWVLDEPFDSLDTAACEWLHRVVDRHLAAGGVVVITSHRQGASTEWPAAVSIDLSARRAEAVAA